MAQPTNTFDNYDVVGGREDLSDVIYNFAPFETPFFSACAKTQATQSLHEWQTDTLRAAADNKHIPGDDTTAVAVTPTVRLGNRVQTFKTAFTLSDDIDNYTQAGRQDEADYQKIKYGRELRKDIEFAMLANNAAVVGSSSVAPELAGVPVWLTTNTNGGTGGSDATGDGTDARTDGTLRDLTETQMNTVLQDAWTSSGNEEYTCYLSAANKRVSAGFEGNAPRRLTEVEAGTAYNKVDMYVTDFGDVSFVKSRHVRGRDVLFLDDDTWKIAVAQDITSTRLAKTGDSEKYQMVARMTLCSGNEVSSAGVFDTNG